MDSLEYHQLELAIASNPNDPRRVLPTIEARHRRVLDVGCGAGQTLLASNLGKTVLAVGVDVDHAALAYGLEQGTNIKFVRARGEVLPFFNDSFDLVICRVALPYMRVDEALSEMSRVLSEGGELWLVLHPFRMTAKELSASLRRLNFKAIFYRLWVLGNGFALHVLGKQSRWPFQRYESWQSVGHIRSTLAKVGFSEVCVSRGDHFVVTARKGQVNRSRINRGTN